MTSAGADQIAKIPREVVSSRADSGSERGFVLVWAAVMMLVLLGLAGLAVDIGNWYLHIQRTQRAADAAALDGDVLMPADVARARTEARETLVRNGVPQAEADAAYAVSTCSTSALRCIAPVAGRPTQLEVRVTTTVHNTFLRLLGLHETNSFARRAVADHRLGLEIGNGRNALGGSEPSTPLFPTRWATSDPYNGRYWLSVEGQDSAKQSGDRYLPDTCAAAHQAVALHGVYGGPSQATCAGTNPEYASQGRNFRVHVEPSAATGTRYLVLQAYDAGYYRTGNGSGVPCASPWQDGVPRNDLANCAGDASADGVVGTAFTTYYGLYPSPTATTPIATCKSYPGTEDAGSAMGNPAIGPYVHEWDTVCTPLAVNVSNGGDYFLRIHTVGGNGMNDFALRAGLSTSASAAGVDVALSQSQVTISADQNMTVDNLFDGGGTPTRFPLAQVSDQWAGQPITFEFFDIGDATGGGGVFSLLSSNGTTVPGTCTYSVTPRAPGTAPASGCAFPYDEDHFNGQLVRFTWTPPTGYVCAPSGPSLAGGCWIYVQMHFGAGVAVDDTTTWTLDYPSKPLRLVK